MIKKNAEQQMSLFIQVIESTQSLIKYKHLSSSSTLEVTKGIKQCLVGLFKVDN